LLWGVLHKCTNLKRVEVSFIRDALSDEDLCLLARFCPDLEHLDITTEVDVVYILSSGALACVVGKCTKLQRLSLGLWGSGDLIAERVLVTIAANLASLRTLTVSRLQLDNPSILPYLVTGCPQLQELSTAEVKVSEAELLYLVEHAKNLQRLTMNLADEEGGPCEFTTEQLLQFGIADPEAFISEQQSRFDSLRAATRRVRLISTGERLKAASCNPNLVVELF
jgi:hypothetical protein